MQATITFDQTPAQEPGDLRANAERWMRDHPDVVDLFERFAIERAHADQCFAIKTLFERVRWEYALEKGGAFKLNNNYAPYVARELVRRQPLLSHYMRFRRTKYERA